jgi:hypothetical protein
MMSMQRSLFAADRERWIGLDDFVDSVRTPIRIFFVSSQPDRLDGQSIFRQSREYPSQ